MTTTVTITTHDWPVRVAILDEYSTGENEHIVEERRTIPPHSTEHLHITDTRSLSFRELPVPEVHTETFIPQR